MLAAKTRGDSMFSVLRMGFGSLSTPIKGLGGMLKNLGPIAIAAFAGWNIGKWIVKLLAERKNSRPNSKFNKSEVGRSGRACSRTTCSTTNRHYGQSERVNKQTNKKSD